MASAKAIKARRNSQMIPQVPGASSQLRANSLHSRAGSLQRTRPQLKKIYKFTFFQSKCLPKLLLPSSPASPTGRPQSWLCPCRIRTTSPSATMPISTVLRPACSTTTLRTLLSVKSLHLPLSIPLLLRLFPLLWLPWPNLHLLSVPTPLHQPPTLMAARPTL
ncbi:hypothetical protein HYPSUDRAFT_78004, partial [Hypholoma sublateritium FD-334 SS-4]